MRIQSTFLISLYFILIFLGSTLASGQEIRIGFQDSISSEVLNETRSLYIRLPADYSATDKSYPVLYRLDGSINLFTESVGVVRRLAYMEEVIPDMIVVMIGNTDRNRDMMPVRSSFLNSEPGGENFKLFLENELIPYIDSTYRTSGDRILCGQSLSAIFTLYCLLTSPDTFDAYIACSAGFLDIGDYFIHLTEEMLKTRQAKVRKIFLTHGEMDFLDPNGAIKEQLQYFIGLISREENLVCKLQIYEDEGHVPYPSLYHGLKFIYE
jgi:predicted alpha/beta superfamily hydrolase